jgi:uncharacterized protein (TIGR01244 family)
MPGAPKTLLTLALLLACGGASLAQEVKKPDAPVLASINNFKQLSPEIATAGQPSDADLKALKDAGFKTILNLRPPAEGSLEEKPKVESLGMTYVNIPITPDTITEEKIQLFSEVVGDASNKPLLIHCASANRVGGLWYIHRRLKEGAPEEKSLSEAHDIGLTSPALEQIVRDHVEKHKTKPQ